MIESKQTLSSRGGLAGLLLFVAACTLSTEDIHLAGTPTGEGGAGEETSDGVGNQGGGGEAGRSDSPADAGALGGSGGVARGMGGNSGGTAGSPGTGGSVPGGAGSGGGTPEQPPPAPAPAPPPPPAPAPMPGGPSGSGGANGSGGSTPPASGGMSGAGSEVPPSTRATSFDFETGTQGWQDIKGAGTEVTRTTERAWSGSASLEIAFATKKSDVEKTRYIGVLQDQTPLLRPGQTIRFHFFIPSGKDSSALFGLQPFAISKGGVWQGNFKQADPLARNTWIDFDLTLPNDYDTQDLLQFGVQALTKEDGTRVRFYVDGVTF